MFYKTCYSQTSFLRDLTNSFQLVGLYEDGNWSPGNAYIYVTLIYNLRFWSRRWCQSCRSWWSYETADILQYLSDIFDIWSYIFDHMFWSYIFNHIKLQTFSQHLSGAVCSLPLLFCHKRPSETVRSSSQVLHCQKCHLPLLLAG